MADLRLVIDVPMQWWLTSNRHIINRPHRASIIRNLHSIAAAEAIRARLPRITERVDAYWTVQYPKGVRLDKGEASNAQPTTKALLDGLCPHILPDDGPPHVRSERFERGPNLTVQGVHRIALRLSPVADSLPTQQTREEG